MKTLIVLAFIVLAGCSGPFYINTEGYVEQEMDLDEAWEYVSSFKYTWEEIDEKQYVKSPHEFEKDGGGDCEDFCVYLMYLLGKESKLVAVLLNDEILLHALVLYNNKYIDPQIYNKYYDESDFTIIKTYSYEYIMRAATNLGTKNI